MFTTVISTVKIPNMSGNANKYPSRVSVVDPDDRPPNQPCEREEYEKKQRKQRAELILAQHDLLIRYAVENQLSIPQTRQYFRKVALGIPTAPVIKNWFPN
ncbi:uncharacterized protein Z519_12468 [Cladophialophora bantiana CBS 173.52]|uniref:Uncharacterized protein n=1 Tax=Cladophialophora bantiana (strain ATCC 10958 / CBS 173.52 / CDC B-1940 / NIH 8579) TaxID=1442370 RepID=A0A0D2H1B8_CLAB1|nr:uncharacterized protein Z519_12468 [Cladophialophora bantiana CBS 173.52]KIW87003.1 hypothetical protein Z519_12468 [Cladophialophora bantiana CBS 173.52]